jgi:hypothetical protein
MNLIGKIFTVFVLLMAVTFAAFAMAVYATHRNWMAAATTANTALAALQTARDNEKQVYEAKIVRLQDEKARQAKEIARADTESEDLRKARIDNEKEIASLKQEVRAATLAMKAAHEELENFRTRVTTLTEDLRAARAAYDAKFKEVVRLKDELNSATDEVDRLKKSNEAVAKEVAKCKECLAYFQLNPDSDYKAKQPPVGSRGHVLAVQGSDMVEISLGSDHGLRKGHKLEVVRGVGGGSEYCGRIEVVQTSFDKSVCRVIKEMLRKPMQRGDNVVSELN